MLAIIHYVQKNDIGEIKNLYQYRFYFNIKRHSKRS